MFKKYIAAPLQKVYIFVLGAINILIVKPIKILFKYLKASKTLVFNFILGMAGSIELYSGFLRGLFTTEQMFGVFMVITATVGSILRFITTESMKEKMDEDF